VVEDIERRGKLARRHSSYAGKGRAGLCGAIEYVSWCVIVAVCAVLGSASGVLSRERSPLEPYGTDAEVRQCVADTEAALWKRGNRGFRDTLELIQYRQKLEKIGITEYDAMVARCRNAFFHRYQRLLGRQPQ
jgi:hypothetical protein